MALSCVFALLWSSTIILANFFTFMSVVLLAIILPSSTSARLPLAASLMKCWSGLELLAADELLLEALLAGALELSLLAAGAELFSGVAALLLLLQPAANRPRLSKDIKRLFFMRCVPFVEWDYLVWMATMQQGMGG